MKKNLIHFVIVLVAIIILSLTFVVGYAADSDVVASVNGNNIVLSEFQEAVRFKRFDTIQEYNYMAYLYSMYGMKIDSAFNAQYEGLLSEDGKKELGQNVVTSLIYNKILELESEKQGISVTDEEINKSLGEMFGVNQGGASGEAEEGTEGSLTLNTDGIADPVTESDKADELKAVMDQFFSQNVKDLFSRDYFNSYVYHMLLETKIVDKVFAAEVFEEEMVSARHILVKTADEAKSIIEQLKSGANWDELAAANSMDTGNKDKGGDLGWFAKGMMVKPFEEAAFAMKPGDISDPVETSFGFHVIKLDGKEIRPLEENALKNAQSRVYNAWRMKVESEYQIETFDTWQESIPMEPEFTPIEPAPVEPPAAAAPADGTAIEPEPTPTAVG